MRLFTERNYWICNGKNRGLLFEVSNFSITIHDLFDNSNKTLLPFLRIGKAPLKMHFNETGEELYIFDKEKMYIHLCKCTVKPLVLQCAFVVAKIYTKSQLFEVKLPKQLHKYLF